MTPAQADMLFLENAKKLAMYGVDIHQAKVISGSNTYLLSNFPACGSHPSHSVFKSSLWKHLTNSVEFGPRSRNKLDLKKAVSTDENFLL